MYRIITFIDIPKSVWTQNAVELDLLLSGSPPMSGLGFEEDFRKAILVGIGEPDIRITRKHHCRKTPGLCLNAIRSLRTAV